MAVGVDSAGAASAQDDAREIAIGEGASEELFEALVIEMMSRGVRAERGPIRELIAELSGNT